MHIEKIRQLATWMAKADLHTLAFSQPGFELRLVRATAPSATAAASLATPVAPVIAEPEAPKVAAMATHCGFFHARHPHREQAQVLPGKAVAVGDTVGVIAVGALLLPVIAHTAGTAGNYLVEDGQLVDYATPLLALVGE